MPNYMLTASRGTAVINEFITADNDQEALRKCLGPLMRLAFDPSQPDQATGKVTLLNSNGAIIHHHEESW